MSTKITGLSGFNVRALQETLTAEEAERVTLGKTTAEFDMDARAAVGLVLEAQVRAGEKHGTRGHPYASLHAVLRKLRSAGGLHHGM